MVLPTVTIKSSPVKTANHAVKRTTGLRCPSHHNGFVSRFSRLRFPSSLGASCFSSSPTVSSIEVALAVPPTDQIYPTRAILGAAKFRPTFIVPTRRSSDAARAVQLQHICALYCLPIFSRFLLLLLPSPCSPLHSPLPAHSHTEQRETDRKSTRLN